MRCAALATIVVALAIQAGVATSPAQAQQPSYGGSPGYTTDTWSNYPRAYPWGGYVPANPWGGYAPRTIRPQQGTAWQNYAPATAWGGYTAAPEATAPTVRYAPAPAPTVRYAPAQRATTSRRAPAYYREYGTGRNVFMHKPWLPNQ